MQNTRWRLLLAALLVAVLSACDSGPALTPTLVPLPTVAPPRVERPAPTPPDPTATAVPPGPAAHARAAVLLDHWGWGAPVATPADSQPMSGPQAGDFLALALQRAPVITPTVGVQVEPAITLADGAGRAQRMAFGISAGGDLLAPYRVVWAEHGAAAAILFSWRVAGRPVDDTPFLVVDAQGARQGPVLWTVATADAPLWAPGGRFFAYVDAGAAPPRLTLADGAAQARVSGPAAHLECDRCWPEQQWAPAGDRLAYTTSAPLPGATPAAEPQALAPLTWRLVVLDAGRGRVVFDRTGQAIEAAHILNWVGGDLVQVVLRRPLLPAEAITGTQGQWVDSAYQLHLDGTSRLDPAPP